MKLRHKCRFAFPIEKVVIFYCCQPPFFPGFYFINSATKNFMYKETPPNGYGWNKPTNWKQQKNLTKARHHQYVPMNQLLDVQPKSSMPSYHPRAPSGQPWSRLNLLPSEALRRATHVRRLQFRSGEPWGKKEDETQKHRGEWVGVRSEMQPKPLKWLVGLISHRWHGPQLVIVRLILEW